MKRYAILLAMLLAGVTWAFGDGSAQETASRNSGEVVYQEEPPPPGPGFKWVREVRYREQQYPVCKRVPDKRYKWVYDTRPDYYCLPPCPFHLHHRDDNCQGCQDCQNCKGPYYRPQLKKMLVEMNCGWKCVLEYVKYKVPQVAWRKVRIDAKEAEEDETPEKLPRPTTVPPPPARQPQKGEPER
jgi:hypothetical protein